MSRGKSDKSRRTTPWTGREDIMTPAEKLTHYTFVQNYTDLHPPLGDSLEVGFINSHVPKACPYCHAEQFSMKGLDNNGIQRYRCNICGKRFKPTTGTIFDSRRIPLTEWVQYLLNLFHYVSITADSWNNKNTFQTSSYWLKKVFLVLEGYQNDIVLGGKVWLDETYYSIVMRDRKRDSDGKLLRGISDNQLCIGVATDKTHTLCLFEGTSRPTQKRSLSTFNQHINPGSTLIHDKENTHKSLVRDLNLKSEEHDSKTLKGIPDSRNPLYPVNHTHFLLKSFLNAHSGFDRDNLSGYLNLFAFIMNPPDDYLEKVARILDLGFQNPKTLKYRDAFGVNSGK